MGLDLMGPFPTSADQHYILLVMDYFSKLVEEIPTSKNDATTVCRFLKKFIFSRFGTPRALISVEGTHFINKLLTKLLSKYNVKHRVEKTYHSQSNGHAEVSNIKIKRIYRKWLESQGKTGRSNWMMHYGHTVPHLKRP